MSWHRFTEQLKEYFIFTRKERNGIMVLLGLLLFMQAALYYTHYYTPVFQPTDITAFRNEALALQQESTHDSIVATAVVNNADVTELFPFDPNTLSAEGWKSLGINQRAVQSILNYRNKGGKFYKKEDVKKIYNLNAAEYVRLEPYITISDNRKSFEKNAPVTPAEIKMVELNSARAEELMTLPMIGEKRAAQIINYRNKLGGYIYKEQLAEVYSLPDSIFTMIAPRIHINTSLVRPIHINQIESDTVYHPYLKRSLLKLIISYRNQHGPYTGKEVLRKLPLMTDSVFQKLQPYISLE